MFKNYILIFYVVNSFLTNHFLYFEQCDEQSLQLQSPLDNFFIVLYSIYEDNDNNSIVIKISIS